jgi:subtilisin
MTIDASRRELLRNIGAGGIGALALNTGTAAGNDSGEYNVGTASPAAERAARDRAEAVVRVLDWGGGKKTITGRYSQEAIDNLDNRPDVRYTEVNGELHAIDAELDNSWGVDRVDAEVGHADGESGSGADIAIIDTGIDDDHPDLDANIGKGIAIVECGTRSCGGPPCPTGNCNQAWSDDHDHGTHVAGIADAEDNGEGVVGVSTEATLHAVKVLDCNGCGSFSDVATGIKQVADEGWDVGNMSLGGSKSDTVEDAVEYAYGKGVLLVAAAGNDGPCTDCVSYPAAEPEVIAVSATNKDDCLASFSSQGPEVELAGPGKDVYSTVIDGYDTFSGTSMASPHVAGAGGLLMANGASNTDARDQLNSTAEDVGLSDNEQGNGLVDAAAALGLDSSDSQGSCGSSDNSPSVDSLLLDEVETDNDDAEFDAAWDVSDEDGDLDSVDLTLYELDSDGNRVDEEDSATESVSGDSASGTTRLVATGDDGTGNTYELEAIVSDSNGNTDSATATETESESSGDSAPSASIEGVSEVNSPSPHAEFDISWSASDDDDDLDTAELTLYDDTDSETEDSDSSDISGMSASGTTTLKAKFDEGTGNEYTVELVVTDANGNTDTDTTSFSEDGT